VDAFEAVIRQQLDRVPTMPATVIAERVGWTRGMTVFKERHRIRRQVLRPQLRHSGTEGADRNTASRSARRSPSPASPGMPPSNSRIRGSNPWATDPAGTRSYLGGPELANAAFTVFLEIPNSRAISEIDNCSARRSRWISAQSSTLSTRFLPSSTRARVSGKPVSL
jgi:hypothetical protein